MGCSSKFLKNGEPWKYWERDAINRHDHTCRYQIAIAHTQWGDIPGKSEAGSDTCYFSYGGEEHTTNDFSYALPSPLVRNSGGSVPEGALATGYQTGTLYSAIAHTQWGDIPGKVDIQWEESGKAQAGSCLFPYGGQEHSTHEFSWIVGYDGHRLEKSSEPPIYSLPHGFQNDGAGTLWVAVAHTQWGDIPGKAQGTNCWFSHGGNEIWTDNFSWIVMQ